MKSTFYLWLLIQLLIAGATLWGMTYKAENCLLETELDKAITEKDAIIAGIALPIPMIITYLWGDNIKNRNCE